jgi:tripartite-type tricarboxylate transporter receptor subunit TctC
MRHSKLIKWILTLCLAVGLTSAGFAADFPSKPIRLITPFAPGGSNSVVGQALQLPLGKALGTKILFEPIGGASTKTGTNVALNASPDGYTIILTSDVGWVFLYYAKVYSTKVWEQLTPIGNVTSEPFGLIEVRMDSPFKTWADLVKAAKENPGKLTCGGTGAGMTPEFLNTQINKAAGIVTTYVPFGGGGPSNMALLGGHVDFLMVPLSDAYSLMKGGKSRVLAIAADNRMADFPDIPTWKELGLGQGVHFTRSIWGPPNLPAPLVQRLTNGIAEATKDPEFRKLIESLHYTVEYGTPEKVLSALKNFDRNNSATLQGLNK